MNCVYRMQDTILFILIIIIFLLFIMMQIYFYMQKYNKNTTIIKNVEQFEAKLNNKEYILNDESIEILLEDYNKLKKNI